MWLQVAGVLGFICLLNELRNSNWDRSSLKQVRNHLLYQKDSSTSVGKYFNWIQITFLL